MEAKKLPRCVKCGDPIWQARKGGTGEWLDYGDGKGQHIVCPRPSITRP